MKDLVDLTRVENIGVITINNPPVNALSHEVRKGIMNAVQQAVKAP